jgi:hypothetical protein
MWDELVFQFGFWGLVLVSGFCLAKLLIKKEYRLKLELGPDREAKK